MGWPDGWTVAHDWQGKHYEGALPLGLDSHRYRCAGNGVVSNVSEWIGVRLAQALR
jgi:site-specific DNA-cytosine methylase